MTEYMVGRAYAMQATEFAPTEYQAALTALTDARKAMGEADYSDARDSLEFALKHARRAFEISREGLAIRAEQETQRAKAEQEALEADRKARVKAEEEARQAQTATPPKKGKIKAKPQVVPATDYLVGDGETLWTISAHPEVYHEGLLWPLLYQANRDQIKDPRQIFPGQTLSIRRDMTAQELEDARQRARESDIFPVPKTAAPEQ